MLEAWLAAAVAAGAKGRAATRTSLLAATAVVITLALGAGTAAAAEEFLEFDDTSSTITIPRFTITGPLGIDIVCSVTLDLTVNEYVDKTRGLSVGTADVTVDSGRCSEGDMGLLVGGSRSTTAGPYDVTYVSYSGTLPTITGVSLQLNDMMFWGQNGSYACLTAAGLWDLAGTTTGGNPADDILIRASSLPLAGGGLCAFSTASLSADGTFDEAVGIAERRPADLVPDPQDLIINGPNGSIRLTNDGGLTATVETTAHSANLGYAGCTTTTRIAAGSSCTILLTPRSRPLADEWYQVNYDNGRGRTKIVAIDVEVR